MVALRTEGEPARSIGPRSCANSDPALTTRWSKHRMAKRPLPTPAELRQLLRYEPETGVFAWIGRRSSRKPLDYLDQTNGYKRGSVRGSYCYAHRVAWAVYHGLWPQGDIDHINGDRTDNRISNLRDVSHSDNCRNHPLFSNNSSGNCGVSWDAQTGRWRASISIRGEYGQKIFKCLGRYDDKADAIKAADAAREQHGFHPNHGRQSPW
jgi:hypothetical protein